MIFLAGLLWFQVILLAFLGTATVFMSAKERRDSGRIATVSALTFGVLIAISLWAALTVGSFV